MPWAQRQLPRSRSGISYAASMLLASVVDTSRSVTETTKRLEKIDLLARLIRQLNPEEIEIVVLFLSGQIRQGRIGIGYAALRDARRSPAANPSVEVLEVDGILQDVTHTSGSGSQRRRMELLESLFARATESEQQFLTRLLLGELRQGALEGDDGWRRWRRRLALPAERVRRAAMMAGSIAQVARAALEKGEAGLAQYEIELFRPIQPMLAQSADDVPEALACIGEAALEYKMDGARVQVHKSGDDVAVYSQKLEGCDGGGSGSSGGYASAAGKGPGAGRRSDQPASRWPPTALPDHHAPVRTQAGCRACAPKLPMTPFWFDLLYLERQPAAGRNASPPIRSAGGNLAAEHLIPHTVTSNPDSGQGISRTGASQRSRRHHGQSGAMPNTPPERAAKAGSK